MFDSLVGGSRGDDRDPGRTSPVRFVGVSIVRARTTRELVSDTKQTLAGLQFVGMAAFSHDTMRMNCSGQARFSFSDHRRSGSACRPRHVNFV
jgi:hypothetical protein